MFPAIESSVMTRYYRSAITIPTAFEGISAFEVGVFTKYGFILYANGQEVARVNLPATVDESLLVPLFQNPRSIVVSLFPSISFLPPALS